jgi:hypothetical protein
MYHASATYLPWCYEEDCSRAPYDSVFYTTPAEACSDKIIAQGTDEKGSDTVGQPPSAEICESIMPSLKAKRLRKLPHEKVHLEL